MTGATVNGAGLDSYSYDWQNHLVQVNQPSGSTQFRYDGDGHLAQRSDATGTVDYIGDPYEKNVTTGAETKRYYQGSTLVATSVGGTLSYLHSDYLHSTVSASNGTAVEYSPYGLVRSSSGTLPTDHQFQDQQNQAGVGLYHMGARWYDPTIGLWTQPDTSVPNPLIPERLNRFTFAFGDPLRFVDPSGHTVQLPTDVAPASVIIDIAEPLQIDQGAVTVASPLESAPLITVAAPDLEPCCVTIPAGAPRSSPLIQTEKDASVPQSSISASSLPTLDRRLGGTYDDKMEAHHLIPDRFEKDPIVQWAVRAGWDINDTSNGILLPDNPDPAKEAGLPYHRGKHSDYSSMVDARLRDIEVKAELNNWTDLRVARALYDLDIELRDYIQALPAGSHLD